MNEDSNWLSIFSLEQNSDSVSRTYGSVARIGGKEDVVRIRLFVTWRRRRWCLQETLNPSADKNHHIHVRLLRDWT